MGFFLRGDDDNTGFVSSECEIAWSMEIFLMPAFCKERIPAGMIPGTGLGQWKSLHCISEGQQMVEVCSRDCRCCVLWQACSRWCLLVPLVPTQYNQGVTRADHSSENMTVRVSAWFAGCLSGGSLLCFLGFCRHR